MFGWDQHWRRYKGRAEQTAGGAAFGGVGSGRELLTRIKPN